MLSERVRLSTKSQATFTKKLRETLRVGPGSEVIFKQDITGRVYVVPIIQNPFEEMKKMKPKNKLSSKEIDDIIRKSRKEEDRFDDMFR